MTEPWIRTERAGATLNVAVGGDWTLAAAARMDPQLQSVAAQADGGIDAIHIDAEAVGRLDTAGAWLLVRTRRELAATGRPIDLVGRADPRYRDLIGHLETLDCSPPEPMPGLDPVRRLLARVGQGALRFVDVGRDLLNFLGLVVTVLVRVLARPWRLRATALVTHMEDTGLNALPIIGLLSFLIGVVLAYNGAVQLRPFGAEVFTINLIGIGTLREFGVLITAIIVAGRSGSAFTAAIGSMRVNQETDAIETMGLDPIEVLVVPRLLALIIVMPLLTFWANMAGLLGGTVVVMQLVGMTFGQIAEWFLNGVNSANFWLGMIKAPIFGALIALVGCHQGLMVKGSADSLGRLTTRSVVISIFLVIVVDAIFSVATTQIGL